MPKKVNVDDKLEYICEKAYEELLKNGITHFSLNKFIDSLQMSKGQFYYYFKTKEALICKTIDQKCYEAFAYTYEQTKSKSTFLDKMNTFFAFFLGNVEPRFADLDRLLKSTFHLYVNADNSAIKQLNTEFYQLLFSYIEEIFDELIEKGHLHQDTKKLARSLIATADGMYLHALMNDNYDMKVYFSEYLIMLDALLKLDNEGKKK